MNSEGKPEPIDPETNARMIELDLMRQRAARQSAGTPYQGLRIASFLFLVVVILGALVAFYYIFSSGRLDEMRANRHSSTGSATASPSP